MKKAPTSSRLRRKLKREFNTLGFSRILPSAKDRISALEKCLHILSDEFSVSEVDQKLIFRRYVECAAEFIIAIQYRKESLIKDRLSGRLVDEIIRIQYHLEQAACSGLLEVTQSEYETVMRVLVRMRDMHLRVLSSISKFIKNNQFSTRAIHEVHAEIIEIICKTTTKKAPVYSIVCDIHNMLFSERPIDMQTIIVEYGKIKKDQRSSKRRNLSC